MEDNNQHSSYKRQGKDTKFTAQLKAVYQALLVKPMTMKELDVYTGIMRENICRYIATLRKENKVAITQYRRCTITGHKFVAEYTTDQNLFPVSNQLNLF